MRHALAGVVSCALALSLATTPVYANNGQTKFKPTRAVVLDKATGKPRMPNAAEVQQMVSSLKTLTQKSTAVAATELKDGGRKASLGGGYGGVMLARVRPDGSYELRCVFSFEEGASFLGLVADNSASQ
jgi:hypothetical protein